MHKTAIFWKGVPTSSTDIRENGHLIEAAGLTERLAADRAQMRSMILVHVKDVNAKSVLLLERPEQHGHFGDPQWLCDHLSPYEDSSYVASVYPCTLCDEPTARTPSVFVLEGMVRMCGNGR